jgi:hypothetical protein
LAVERGDGQAQKVGRPERRGDASQESEPSWYRTSLEAHAKETIVWHRRETRRPTENTNRLLRGVGTVTEKHGEQNRAEGRGVGRWRREVQHDAAQSNGTFTSASNG